MKEMTKETIDKIMAEVAEEFRTAPKDRLLEALDGLPSDAQNNTHMIALAAAAATQANTLLIIKEVLYKLLEE